MTGDWTMSIVAGGQQPRPRHRLLRSPDPVAPMRRSKAGPVGSQEPNQTGGWEFAERPVSILGAFFVPDWRRFAILITDGGRRAAAALASERRCECCAPSQVLRIDRGAAGSTSSRSMCEGAKSLACRLRS